MTDRRTSSSPTGRMGRSSFASFAGECRRPGPCAPSKSLTHPVGSFACSDLLPAERLSILDILERPAMPREESLERHVAGASVDLPRRKIYKVTSLQLLLEEDAAMALPQSRPPCYTVHMRTHGRSQHRAGKPRNGAKRDLVQICPDDLCPLRVARWLQSADLHHAQT